MPSAKQVIGATIAVTAIVLMAQLIGPPIWTGTIQPFIDRIVTRIGPQWAGTVLLLGGLFAIFATLLILLAILQRE